MQSISDELKEVAVPASADPNDGSRMLPQENTASIETSNLTESSNLCKDDPNPSQGDLCYSLSSVESLNSASPEEQSTGNIGYEVNIKTCQAYEAGSVIERNSN